jgi:pyruvate formate lyase activating enzyme
MGFMKIKIILTALVCSLLWAVSGVSQTPVRIIQSTEEVLEKQKQLVIRIPLIPGITSEAHNIDQLIKFLKNIRFNNLIHLLPFHRIAENKYQKYHINNRIKGLEEMKDNDVKEIANKFRDEGLEVKVGG